METDVCLGVVKAIVVAVVLVTVAALVDLFIVRLDLAGVLGRNLDHTVLTSTIYKPILYKYVSVFKKKYSK